MKRKTRSILFDMDGVILDSMPYHVMAWQEALSEYGLSVSSEVLYLHEGAIGPETATAVLQKNGCPIDTQEFYAILRRQEEIFVSRYRSMIRPFPEVPYILKRLCDAGRKLVLVTSSYEEIVERVLPPEVKACMSYIITGDHVKKRKPFPDPYLAALSALRQGPESCLVVENAPAGITAAKAAAIPCIAITTTLAKKYLSEADAILTSHAELIDYILGE
jgi:beta-phosphoglucomutase